MALSKQVLGDRVREIRQMKGMTQLELAKVAGLERTHISRIENATYNIQLDTLVLLAQGLRVTLSEFFETIEIEDIYITRKITLG